MITLKEIDKDNLLPVLKLKVKDNQKDLVASNAVSIAQAHYSDEAWFRAIYFEDTIVGFLMLSLDDVKKEYWIWRFMIDKEHQLKGYGKAAVLKAIEFVKTIPDAKELMLSYVPKKEANAKFFYEKCGFKETGNIDDESGEVEMKLSL